MAHDADRLRAVTREGIAAEPPSMGRRRDLLPAGPADPTRLPVGGTPLVPAPRLADRLGSGEVWVKNDAANPAHSFKNRVVAGALDPIEISPTLDRSQPRSRRH